MYTVALPAWQPRQQPLRAYEDDGIPLLANFSLEQEEPWPGLPLRLQDLPWLDVQSLEDTIRGAGKLDPASIFKVGFSTTDHSITATTSLTLSVPVGTQAGDLLIASLTVKGGTGTTVTAPAGWHLINPRTDFSNWVSMLSYWKPWVQGETSYTWTMTSTQACGGIQSWRGCDLFNPVHASGGTTTNTSQVIAAPSIATQKYGQLVCVFGTDSHEASWGSLSDALVARYNLGTDPSAVVSIADSDAAQSVVGLTGQQTDTCTTAAHGVGMAFVLVPAGSSIVPDQEELWWVSLQPSTTLEVLLRYPPALLDDENSGIPHLANFASELEERLVTEPWQQQPSHRTVAQLPDVLPWWPSEERAWFYCDDEMAAPLFVMVVSWLPLTFLDEAPDFPLFPFQVATQRLKDVFQHTATASGQTGAIKVKGSAGGGTMTSGSPGKLL